MKKFIFAAMLAAASLAAATADARSYKFRVTCETEKHVEEWGIGAVDPGREYLRVITGADNPNCSVADFNEQRDGDLPVKSHRGAVAVGEGIVSIICGWIGC